MSASQCNYSTLELKSVSDENTDSASLKKLCGVSKDTLSPVDFALIQARIQRCFNPSLTDEQVKELDSILGLIETTEHGLTDHSSNFITQKTHSMKTMGCATCGYTWTARMRCRDRLCPECKSLDSARILGHWKDIQFEWPMLLTFTIRSNPDLFVMLKTFTTALKRLRRQAWFKRSVVGGLYVFEATYKKGVGWHLHCHMLCDSRWVYLSALRELHPNDKRYVSPDGRYIDIEWGKLTGNPRGVNIVRAFSQWSPRTRMYNSLCYLLKYVSKPMKMYDADCKRSGYITDAYANEFRTVMRGKRLISGFGKYYSITNKIPQKKYSPVCPSCGSLDVGIINPNVIGAVSFLYCYSDGG